MFSEFLSCIENKPAKRICVIGDSMLDEYYDVSVKKISPEFPIPVMCSEEDISKNLPGGAANVAHQFKKFNVDVELCSFLDWFAAEIFFREGIKTENSYIIDSKIPRKKRFYSDGFPTYRWDVEQVDYGLKKNLKACQENLYKKIESNVENFDVVIFSDYDKGVFSDDIFKAVNKSKISIVDPKGKDIDKWKHCTIFKPNKKEALELTGCNTVEQAGFSLLKRLECEAVVITEADQGVSVFDQNGFTKIFPPNHIEKAKSVIGAGDCFVAFLAMCVAHNFPLVKSVEIAWNAGLLYVKNILNKPISPDDLIREEADPRKKILNDVDFLLDREFSLVFANGCFDLLHTGHISLLNFAKKQGEKLIVAVNSDFSVSRLKEGRPFVNLADRMLLLANLSCVDYVVSFEDDTPIRLIKKLKPDVLVKGSEYKAKDIVGGEHAKKVVVAPMLEGVSTTALVNKIILI